MWIFKELICDVYSWSWRLYWWISRSRLPEHTKAASESDARAGVQDHGASQRTHVCIVYDTVQYAVI